MKLFDLDSRGAPALVWWSEEPHDGWLRLDHLCGGINQNRLGGWVKEIHPAPSAKEFLFSLDSQEFARGCRGENLDYEVSREHRAAYAAYLGDRGVHPGDLSLLQQAVYPLGTDGETLDLLGLLGHSPPPNAALLVLGWNNH
jgi:hypothetical protein